MPTTTTRKKPARKSTKSEVSTHPLAHLIPPMSEYESFQDRYVFGDMTDFDYIDMAYNGSESDDGSTHRYNLLIEGHTGSAKTTLIRAWAAKHQRPLYTISGAGSLDTDVLIGGPGIDANGKIRPFVPGVLVECMIYGAIVMVDERNYIPPKQFGRFNSLYDSRKTIMLPEAAGSGWCATCGLYNDADRIEAARRAVVLAHVTGKGSPTPVECEHCGSSFHSDYVVAHNDFFIVDAQNPGYVGTYETNEAARNRYQCVLEYNYSPTVEAGMLWSSKLIEFAENLRSRLGTDVSVPLGTNRLLDFEQIALNTGFEVACENLIMYFPSQDRPHIRQTLEQYAPEIMQQIEAGR